MRRGNSALAPLVLVTALIVTTGSARHVFARQLQQPSPSGSAPMPSIGADKMPEPGDGVDAHMRHVSEAQAMDERHKKMETDADKLLQLATDLKAEVDHSTKNETSVSAYMKADQIEKLAHDVKQRLKN